MGALALRGLPAGLTQQCQSPVLEAHVSLSPSGLQRLKGDLLGGLRWDPPSKAVAEHQG